MSWFDRIKERAQASQQSKERKKYLNKYNEGATAETPTITIGTGFVNGLQREGEYGFEFGAVAVGIDIDNNWSDWRRGYDIWLW